MEPKFDVKISVDKNSLEEIKSQLTNPKGCTSTESFWEGRKIRYKTNDDNKYFSMKDICSYLKGKGENYDKKLLAGTLAFEANSRRYSGKSIGSRIRNFFTDRLYTDTLFKLVDKDKKEKIQKVREFLIKNAGYKTVGYQLILSILGEEKIEFNKKNIPKTMVDSFKTLCEEIYGKNNIPADLSTAIDIVKSNKSQ